MRIVFTVIGNSRRSNYLNGDTLRYQGGGGSGTDTSSIVVAEYLASQGHEVVFVTEALEPKLEEIYKSLGRIYTPGEKIGGVIYTNLNFDGVENKEFDILINSLWFFKYKELPIKVTKALIYWNHMQWIYGLHEIIEYTKENNLKLGFVNISEWEKSMTQGVIDSIKSHIPHTKQILIPNPVMDDIINEVLETNPTKKTHKFIFHAAWARGGNIAIETVKQLNYPDSEFHAFDYLMATHAHEDSFFKMHNGVDKKTLFTHLAESDYFIYPLYTPYKDVHKDTFSCVVAEAIALGAIPVTYPLGALPENFEGHCIWIDFPDKADPAKMQSEPLSKDEEGIFKDNIPKIIEKIKYLEDNPQLKEELRSKGKQYILDKFNSNKVGSMWINFINQLLNG
jgi:glycosyltransferase involved in cell wall biosynthesis